MKKEDIERITKAANETAASAAGTIAETYVDMNVEERGVVICMERVHNENDGGDSNAEMEKRKRNISEDNWGGEVLFVSEKRMEGLHVQYYKKLRSYLTGNDNCREDGEKTDIDPTFRASMNSSRPGTGILKVVDHIERGIDVTGKLVTAIAALSGPMLAVIAALNVLLVVFATLWETNEEFRNMVTVIWAGICSKITAFIDAMCKRVAAIGIGVGGIGNSAKDFRDTGKVSVSQKESKSESEKESE